MTNDIAKKRAIAGTLFFSVVGLAGALILVQNWTEAWPLVLFYFTLVSNTYFSILYFSKIIPPHHPLQILIDVILTILSATLALLFNHPVAFMLDTTLLFAVATFKYASALPLVKDPSLLYRKVKMDALGVATSAIILTGVMMGAVFASTVIWAIGFFATNAYVLFIKPLYTDA